MICSECFVEKLGNSRSALNIVLSSNTVFISFETLSELVEVLDRPKFDKYFDAEDKIQVLKIISLTSKYIEIKSNIKICRDPNDEMFLNLAIDGKANIIISRDPDLLVLNPFQGISILNPSDFLDWLETI